VVLFCSVQTEIAEPLHNGDLQKLECEKKDPGGSGGPATVFNAGERGVKLGERKKGRACVVSGEKAQ